MTLETFAAYKGLPVDFLYHYGLRNDTYYNVSAVRIPYWSTERAELHPRYRISLDGTDTTGRKKTVSLGKRRKNPAAGVGIA